MDDIIVQKVIVAVAFTPMIWILYGIMRSYTKPMQNIVLGVTLPYGYLRDEQILGISKVYRKSLLFVALICFFCFVPVFFLNTPLGIYSATVLWAMISACTIQLPYVRSNARVKRIKQKSGWNLPDTADKLLVNTQVSANKRKGAIKIGFFAIPFLLSLLPFILELVFKRNQMLVALSPLFSTLVMFALYLLFRHSRSRIPSRNTEIDMQVNENFQNLWSHFGFNASISNLIMLFFTYFTYAGFIPNNRFMVTIVVLSCSFYLVFALLVTIYKVRHYEERTLAKGAITEYADNDRHWMFGVFYYNPNDSKTFMTHRMGIGIGLNFAKPFAKVMMAFIALLFIAHLALLIYSLM